MVERPSGLLCPPRWGTPRTTERRTFGAMAPVIASAIGFELMPWQQHTLDVGLEVDVDTGHMAYRTIVLTVPRQNGKSFWMLIKMLLRMIAMAEYFGRGQRMAYTAQDRNMAKKRLLDELLPMIQDSKAFRGEKGRDVRPGNDYSFTYANGEEAIRWNNRSEVIPLACEEKSGHGLTLDEVHVDEAFHHQDDRADGSLKPTLNTRPDGQFVIVSTKGTWKSVWLNGKIDAGRLAVERGDLNGLAYFEWSAPRDLAIDDPATWRMCMPALGYTLTEAVVQDALASMPEDEFRRAFLNQTTGQGADQALDLEAWGRQGDPDAMLVGEVMAGVAIDPDRTWAAIGVAGRSAKGDLVVESVDCRPGVRWVLSRLADVLVANTYVDGVAIAPGSPAGGLIADLEGAGHRVYRVSPQEYAQGCGALYDRLVDGEVFHRSQAKLDQAAVDAERKSSGDGAFYWSRSPSKEGANITPLEAGTLALQKFLELNPEGSIYDEHEGFPEW